MRASLARPLLANPVTQPGGIQPPAERPRIGAIFHHHWDASRLLREAIQRVAPRRGIEFVELPIEAADISRGQAEDGETLAGLDEESGPRNLKLEANLRRRFPGQISEYLVIEVRLKLQLRLHRLDR